MNDLRAAYDVVVVGGGGAGLACAVRAAELGADVLLLEKQPGVGGTTGRAVGSFTAAGTRLQRRAGVVDNPDDHEDDAAKFGPREHQARNNPRLRRLFLGEAAATLDWLTSMGLVFHGPSPEPPNRVPRMHNVVPNAKAYVATLQARLNRLGGTVAASAPVEELVVEDGRVAGVVARIEGEARTFRAQRGVVLAAGDYASSPELIAAHRGARYAAIEGINPHATGDGQRLARSVGARLVNMDITYGPELRFVPPRTSGDQLLPTRGPLMSLLGRMLPLVPRRVVDSLIRRLLVTWQHPEDALLADGAILVNRDGRRFCDETASPERELEVAEQPGKVAFVLLDERLAERYSEWPHFVSTAPEIAYAYVEDYLRLRPDVAIASSSLAGLAESRGLPAEAVLETVEAVNAASFGRLPDELGRRFTKPLSGGRWVLLGPVKAYFTTTEGGAAVNESLQVLDDRDRPIPGLYAAGQNGLGGMILWGHGLHIAWALTSGRLAGEILSGERATAADSLE